MKKVVQITASILLEDFLERMFDTNDTVQEQPLSSLLLESEGIGFSLATAVADRVIQWCQSHSEPRVWYTIGKAIGYLTPEDQPTGQYQQAKGLAQQDLTELRRRFQEACPNPQAVMEAYADTVVPNHWSGSLSGAIRKRLDTIFQPLIHHPNQAIADYAQSIINRFQKKIEDACKVDQQLAQSRDQGLEQRFEP